MSQIETSIAQLKQQLVSMEEALNHLITTMTQAPMRISHDEAWSDMLLMLLQLNTMEEVRTLLDMGASTEQELAIEELLAQIPTVRAKVSQAQNLLAPYVEFS